MRDPGGALSCLGGTATGTGSLLFGRGQVSPSEDVAEMNDRCNGRGVRLVRGDARIVSLGLSG